MSSPVDAALTAFAPTPPPPISANGSRPFPRSAVVSAAELWGGERPLSTPRSTRDRPSPSRESLTGATGVVDASAPYSPSLEVTVQPPPMLRADLPASLTQMSPGTAQNVAAGVLTLSSSSPCPSVRSSRDVLRSPTAVQPSQTATSATIPNRVGRVIPPLTFSMSPPPHHRAVEDTVGSGGEAESLRRSDSLPSTNDAGVLSPSPQRGGGAGVGCTGPLFPTASPSCVTPSRESHRPHCEFWLKAPTDKEHLREDQQPALPQRVYQTPLALFVDCVPSPNKGSPMQLAAAFNESGCGFLSSSLGLSHTTPSTSSTDISATTLRTWGCPRGAQLGVLCTSPPDTSPRTSPSSCDATATRTDGGVVRVVVAARTTLSPTPSPVPPPAPSSNCGGGGGEQLSVDVGTAAVASTASVAPSTAGHSHKRHVRHTLSPATSTSPGGSLPLESLRQKVDSHAARLACPPSAPEPVPAMASSTVPQLNRSPSSLMKLFRHRRGAVGMTEAGGRHDGGAHLDGEAELTS